MWLKRADWVKLLTEITEKRVMADNALARFDDFMHERKMSNITLNERAAKLNAAEIRIKELEARILEMQDELNQAKRLALKPGPVMLDDSLFDEVDEDVEKIRIKIREDGADVVLAGQGTDSSLGEL